MAPGKFVAFAYRTKLAARRAILDYEFQTRRYRSRSCQLRDRSNEWQAGSLPYGLKFRSHYEGTFV
jgi:hypothetical protein